MLDVIDGKEIHLKPLQICEGWETDWNCFLDLEPDNDLPIEKIWSYFVEDISHFTFPKGEYFIDLGFYGQYDNREGMYVLYVAQGDFIKGTLYECFESRSSEEIKQKIELYMDLIATGKIQNYEGLPFDADEEKDIGDFLFSSVEEIKEKRDNSIRLK